MCFSYHSSLIEYWILFRYLDPFVFKLSWLVSLSYPLNIDYDDIHYMICYSILVWKFLFSNEVLINTPKLVLLKSNNIWMYRWKFHAMWVSSNFIKPWNNNFSNPHPCSRGGHISWSLYLIFWLAIPYNIFSRNNI